MRHGDFLSECALPAPFSDVLERTMLTDGDSTGFPDPSTATDLDELTNRLRMLKALAGDRPYSAITRSINEAWQRAGRPRSEFTTKSTVAGYFVLGRRRLDEDLLVAIVQALQPDAAYARRWRLALRAIRRGFSAVDPIDAWRPQPDASPELIGRADVLRRLTDLAHDPGSCRIVVIHGMPGAGKTHLAASVAHHLPVERSVDRLSLMANVRGSDPDRPMTIAAALGELLRHLGMRFDHIPVNVEERLERYRTLVRHRSGVIILDDVPDETWVEALLPTGSRCLTIVTSRRPLARLRDTAHLPLGMLKVNESIALLRAVAGKERIDADPRLARQVAQRVGNLPLALTVIGRHMKGHPDWTLADYVACAAALALEGGMRRPLSTVEHREPDSVCRLHRLLALHPGLEFDSYAAAALGGVDPVEAKHCLDEMVEAGLLESAGDRYRVHEMIRAYTRERVEIDEPSTSRRAAIDRLLNYYADTAVLLAASTAPFDHQAPEPPPQPTHPATNTSTEVSRWFETEWTNLLGATHRAAEEGNSRVACGLSTTLWRSLYVRGCHAEARSGLTAALRVAEAAMDPLCQARSLECLAELEIRCGRYAPAETHCESALTLYREVGNRMGEIRAMRGLAVIRTLEGEPVQAIAQLEKVLALTREVGHRAQEARTLAAMGTALRTVPDPQRAAQHLQEALTIAQTIADPLGEREMLTELGFAHESLGQLRWAAECHQRALALANACGDRATAATALYGLGRVHRRTADYRQSLRCHQQALRMAQDIHDPALAGRARDGLRETGNAWNGVRAGTYGPRHGASEIVRGSGNGPGHQS